MGTVSTRVFIGSANVSQLGVANGMQYTIFNCLVPTKQGVGEYLRENTPCQNVVCLTPFQIIS